MSAYSSAFDQLVGRQVVLDAASPYVYLGTLAGEDGRYVVLEDADVHDLRDTASNREVYVREARRYGVTSNRKRVLVRHEEIVSLSVLDDVIP